MHLVVMDVALSATLLRVAPSLKTLTERPDWKPKIKVPNTLILGDSSSLLLDDIHLFHGRSLSGFTLQGATLDCTCDTSYEESRMLQSTAQILQCIPSLASVARIYLQSQHTGGKSGSLTAIAQAFPNLGALKLRFLALSGP